MFIFLEINWLLTLALLYLWHEQNHFDLLRQREMKWLKDTRIQEWLLHSNNEVTSSLPPGPPQESSSWAPFLMLPSLTTSPTSLFSCVGDFLYLHRRLSHGPLTVWQRLNRKSGTPSPGFRKEFWMVQLWLQCSLWSNSLDTRSESLQDSLPTPGKSTAVDSEGGQAG